MIDNTLSSWCESHSIAQLNELTVRWQINLALVYAQLTWRSMCHPIRWRWPFPKRSQWSAMDWPDPLTIFFGQPWQRIWACMQMGGACCASSCRLKTAPLEPELTLSTVPLQNISCCTLSHRSASAIIKRLIQGRHSISWQHSNHIQMKQAFPLSWHQFSFHHKSNRMW